MGDGNMGSAASFISLGGGASTPYSDLQFPIESIRSDDSNYMHCDASLEDSGGKLGGAPSLEHALSLAEPYGDPLHVGQPGGFVAGGLQSVEAGPREYARQGQSNYTTPVANSQADTSNVQPYPRYNSSHGAAIPAMRGGEGEVRVHNCNVSPNRWVHSAPHNECSTASTSGRDQGGPAPAMDPARAARLASVAESDTDPDRDLYETPPPVTRPSRKTGSNDIPIGPRHRVSQQGPTGTRAQDLNRVIISGGPVRFNMSRGRVDAVLSEHEWNFNSDEPLPWNASRGSHGAQIREFSKCDDGELFNYLASRRISTGFLVEIDQFLRSHVEIVKYAPNFVQLINSLPPLEAYLYFLKGYTRPARYIDGVIISSQFTLPSGFQPTSLKYTPDKELDDFFDGFEYRYDILDRIDMEVSSVCNELRYGRFVNANLCRLVCYAVYGNPVDAYKFYEYNYQQEYMPHRYLPEHVVLGEISKPADYSEPTPSCVKGWRNHRDVRYRMARAKDQGVDVIDVLMSEYRLALMKKGFRRVEMDNMCSRAQACLDDERQYPRGVDIVDMIMDIATSHGQQPRPFVPHQASRTSKPSGRRHVVRNRSAEELREAKSVLSRLYIQEDAALANPGRYTRDFIIGISTRRGTSERRYVNALIKYMRDAKRMEPSQASELQRTFTRDKMAGVGQYYKDYLLSLYPSELK